MPDALLQLDDTIFLAVNGLRADYLDTLMYLLTGKFIWVPFYLSLAAALFLSRRPGAALVLLLMCALTIVVTDSSIARLIRPCFLRMRPSNPDNPLSASAIIVNGYRGGAYGFPSCHAANSFALAAFMALVARRRVLGWGMAVWAVLHSYTRLYLGVHYPGDLIVGALYGAAMGALMYVAARALMRVCRIDASPRLPLFTCCDGRVDYGTAVWALPVIVAAVTVACGCVIAAC